MNNPCYFTHKILNAGNKNNLYGHHINHKNSRLTSTPQFF